MIKNQLSNNLLSTSIYVAWEQSPPRIFSLGLVDVEAGGMQALSFPSPLLVP